MEQTPKPQNQQPKTCPHTETYIAVRHVSGLVLRKCKACGRPVD